MRSCLSLVLVTALVCACDAYPGGASRPFAEFPSGGGFARFVLTEVPEDATWEPVRDLPLHLVFDGAGTRFALVGPGPDAGLVRAGMVQEIASGGWALSDFDEPVGLPLYGSSPGRRHGWRWLDLERVEVRPRDVDGDGAAELLQATFAGEATYFADDQMATAPFTAMAEANIEAPSVAAPRFDATALTATSTVLVSFELPAEVVTARLLTTSGQLETSWGEPSRRPEFVPSGPIPWGDTITLVGQARVAGTDGALEPFAVEIPVLDGPPAPWVESFEGPDLGGFVITRGHVELADASVGPPALDGDRFLLVRNDAFEFVFETQVPDTSAPVLRLEARFAYRFPEDRQATPVCTVEVVGDGVRSTQTCGGTFDTVEDMLGDDMYPAASATEQVEVPLAALRGRRAAIAIRGTVYAGTGEFNDAPLPAVGELQLDGLRIVP